MSMFRFIRIAIIEGPFSALTISQCAQLRNDKQVKGDTELLSHVW